MGRTRGSKNKSSGDAPSAQSAGEKTSRTKYNVSAEDFVRAWQTSESTDEVAAKLGMPKPIVFARASTYREQGVQLKKYKRYSNKALDVAGLNALIEGMGETSESPRPASLKPVDKEMLLRSLQVLIELVKRS